MRNTFTLTNGAPNGFSGDLIPDSISPVDKDSAAGYK